MSKINGKWIKEKNNWAFIAETDDDFTCVINLPPKFNKVDISEFLHKEKIEGYSLDLLKKLSDLETNNDGIDDIGDVDGQSDSVKSDKQDVGH